MLIVSPLRALTLLTLIVSSHGNAAEATRTFWEIPKKDGTGRLFINGNPKSKIQAGFESKTWREWALEKQRTPEKIGYIQVMQRPDYSGNVDYFRDISFPYDHPLLLASHKLNFSQSIETPTIESRWTQKVSLLNAAAPAFTPRAEVALPRTQHPSLNHPPVQRPEPLIVFAPNHGFISGTPPINPLSLQAPTGIRSHFKATRPLPICALPVPVQAAPLTSQSHSLQDLMILLVKAAPEKRASVIALIRQHIPDFIDSIAANVERSLPTSPPLLSTTPPKSPPAENVPQENSDAQPVVVSPAVNTHSLHQQALLMVKAATVLENPPATKKEVAATPTQTSLLKSPQGAQAKKSDEEARLKKEDEIRREAQATRDRAYERERKERKEREDAAAQAPKTAKKKEAAPDKKAKLPRTAPRNDTDEELLAAAIKQNELMAAAKEAAAATASQQLFMASFEMCKKTIQSFCKEKKEPDTAKAIIENFFRKTPIARDQMVFIFQDISTTSLAALYYDALNNVKKENALPLLSEELFRHISEFMAQIISEQLAWVKTQQDAGNTQNALIYLEKIHTLATENSNDSPTQHHTLSVTPARNQFTIPLQAVFTMCKEFSVETSSKVFISQAQINLRIKLLKGKIANLLTPVLQLVTTQEQATAFTQTLRSFESDAGYLASREITNNYIAKLDASKKAIWIPYTDQGKPVTFPSLEMDPTQVPFETICTLFQQEMIAYLSQAPLREESFNAIECLVIKLFQKARSPQELFMAVEKTKSRLSTSFIPVEALLVFLLTSPPRITLPQDQLVTLLSESKQQLEIHIADIIQKQKHTLFPLLAHLQRFLPIVIQKLADLSPQTHVAAAAPSDTTAHPVVTAVTLDRFKETLVQSISNKAVRHSLAFGKKDEQTNILKSILSLVTAPEQVACFMDVFRIHGTLLIQDARKVLETPDFEIEPALKELLITEFKKSS